MQAPIVDSLYSSFVGRRKSWIVPLQAAVPRCEPARLIHTSFTPHSDLIRTSFAPHSHLIHTSFAPQAIIGVVMLRSTSQLNAMLGPLDGGGTNARGY